MPSSSLWLLRWEVWELSCFPLLWYPISTNIFRIGPLLPPLTFSLVQASSHSGLGGYQGHPSGLAAFTVPCCLYLALQQKWPCYTWVILGLSSAQTLSGSYPLWPSWTVPAGCPLAPSQIHLFPVGAQLTLLRGLCSVPLCWRYPHACFLLPSGRRGPPDLSSGPYPHPALSVALPYLVLSTALVISWPSLYWFVHWHFWVSPHWNMNSMRTRISCV